LAHLPAAELTRNRQRTAEHGFAMTNSFVLEYWQDDGWFVGRLKGVPGVFSQGKTLADLEASVRDVYHLMVESEDPAPAGAHSKPLAIDS
jgi:predicted RNase H-like HicB family nuclease